MMYTLRNKVQLIGCLGENPSFFTTSKNRQRAKVFLATNETYRNTDGKRVTETQWHTLILWDKLAELAEKYLFKGREIAVEGKLTTRSYIDQQGFDRYVTEVVVSEVLFLNTTGGKRQKTEDTKKR